MLDVTDAAVVDIVMGVTLVGTEGVKHFTSGFTAVLQVTEFVDLDTVDAGVKTLELSNDGGKIVRLLN